ncbi:MAG: P-II family nitrogen regulator [Bacilli bacterium]|nr:P-II family nitrogen regulator [Bacilli bacterium]MDD4608335.1 P-II family nitrogen regulator [Bacilli bacterium]
MNESKEHKLIVVVVKKGLSELVIKNAQEVGAKGSTIINGRGSGVHETSTILGIPIEPEKEIILIVVEEKDANKVLNKIVEKADLNKVGTGIGFVLDVEKVVGMYDDNNN